MANNNSIYNAVFEGVIGAFQQRWLTSAGSSAYNSLVQTATNVATIVDALIPPGIISIAERELMQTLCMGVFSGRYPDVNNNYSDVSSQIVSFYNIAKLSLLPETSGSSGDTGFGISIFDYIPEQYWEDIQNNTLDESIDLSPYIQAAADDDVNRSAIDFPTGTYNIGVPITNNTDDLFFRGSGGVIFLATADMDLNNDGRGAIIYSPDHRLKLDSISFNLNGFNGNGVFLDRCSFPRIIYGGFSSISSGYAGIRGGSILYGVFGFFNVQGPGRCLDFQKGWELVGTSTYYGLNDGLIIFVKGFTSEGWRLCGGMALFKCGEESGINQPPSWGETIGPNAAAWVLGEEMASTQGCNIDFYSNYAELSVGTANPLKCFHVTNNAIPHIYSGEFFGASASVVDSTFMRIVDMAGLTIEGNPNIKRWYYGFDGAYSGNAGNNTLTSFMLEAMTGDVNTLFKAGSGVQPGEGIRNVGGWGDISYSTKYGLQIAPAIRGIWVTVNPNNTPGDDARKINLAQSNRFELTTNPAATIDSSYLLNVVNATRFCLSFTNGNTTLSNATFNLAGGVDKTFANGDIVEFEVLSNNTIKEIGGNYT